MQAESGQLTQWSEQRFFWTDFLTEVRRVMIQTEAVRRAEMENVDNGVWIDSFKTATPGLSVATPTPVLGFAEDDEEEETKSRPMDAIMAARYGLVTRDATPTTSATGTPSSQVSTNEISVIDVTFKGVDLHKYDPTANDKLAYTLEKELQASPMFDPDETKLSGQIRVEDSETFTFGMSLKLKEPLKL